MESLWKPAAPLARGTEGWGAAAWSNPERLFHLIIFLPVQGSEWIARPSPTSPPCFSGLGWGGGTGDPDGSGPGLGRVTGREETEQGTFLTCAGPPQQPLPPSPLPWEGAHLTGERMRPGEACTCAKSSRGALQSWPGAPGPGSALGLVSGRDVCTGAVWGCCCVCIGSGASAAGSGSRRV